MSVSLRPRRVSLERAARVSLVGYNPHGGGSLALSLVFSSSPDEASFHRSRERTRCQTRSRIITLPCANAAGKTPSRNTRVVRHDIHDDIPASRSAIESNDGRDLINISALATIIPLLERGL